MEVKIGVQNASRELVIETDEAADAVEAAVTKALEGQQAALVLADSKGRRILVPTDKLAYVEIGQGLAGQVGFRT